MHNLSTVSKEQHERFHQNIKEMEKMDCEHGGRLLSDAQARRHLCVKLQKEKKKEKFRPSVEMTSAEFVRQKSQILDGIDLSRKGCIDEPIKDLLQLINADSEFVTTSSCSGRVILFCEDLTNGNHKKSCKWLFTSHENIKESDLLNSIDPKEGNNVLKYEPLILHVQCHTLDSAKLMHTCALESGFRNSGITMGKRGKIILAVRSCIGLEVPLTEDGNLLVAEQYLKFLTRKANEKIEENKFRTQRFFCNLSTILGSKE